MSRRRSFRTLEGGSDATSSSKGAGLSRSKSSSSSSSHSKRNRDSSSNGARISESRSERRAREVIELENRSLEEAPPAGSLFRRDGKIPRTFEDLPLSQPTMSGLERGKFFTMTKIQQLAIPHALVGRDVLGAARTGSGKTLAFIVPLLERLFRLGWMPGLGLGAVIISPTRELALQIFEVLRVVGYRHGFTAGLIMGGSDFRKEQQNVHQLAVVICTPGRLLQHLEQTPTMDPNQVQMLVLDEADRLLDLGFKTQLTRIIEYMPTSRQTMLFSATQTKSVKALARLSLRKPEYVSVLNIQDSAQAEAASNSEKPMNKALETVSKGGMHNDRGKAPTPANLAQAYAVCQLPNKVDVLYSFIRSHLKSKVIVFLSSCRQVQFLDAAFRKLRPGVPLMSIHGKIKQQRRMHIYYDFISKPAAVMFATDIAARGLDFPGVDWVVQADCPEDVATYIHRVGRTARFKNRGNSLLLLLPNEAPAMVAKLREAHIPVLEKKMNPNKQQDVQKKLSSEVAKDAELKLNAQRAFKSYLRSVYLQSDKTVFDVNKLPMGAFAQSLGLANTPRIKFQGASGEEGRKELRKQKNMPRALNKLNELMALEGGDLAPEDDDDDVMELLNRLRSSKALQKAKKTKYERLLALKASDPMSQSKLARGDDSDDDSDSDDDDDDGLVFRSSQGPLAARNALLGDDDGDDENKDDDLMDENYLPSRKQMRKLRIDSATGASKGRIKPQHKVFDEEGDEVDPFAKLANELGMDEDAEDKPDRDDTVRVSDAQRKAYLERISKRLAEEDVDDRERERARVREKHRTERLKRRAALREDQEEGGVAFLGGAGDDEEGGEGDYSGDEQSYGNDSDGGASSEDEGRPNKRAKKMESVQDMEQAALNLIQQGGL